MKRIVIVGAGDQGAIVADILRDAAIGFVDDCRTGAGILGPLTALRDIEHDGIIVAIGGNALRRRLTERLVASGERLATAIHRFSSIAPSATIGEGSMISAGAVVTPRARLGRGVLLNTKASIDHDSVVGDFAHIAPGATIGAGVHIGEETLIAAGATVVARIRIGARTTIGAGAVVVRDVGDDVVAYGVPARIVQ